MRINVIWLYNVIHFFSTCLQFSLLDRKKLIRKLRRSENWELLVYGHQIIIIAGLSLDMEIMSRYLLIKCDTHDYFWIVCHSKRKKHVEPTFGSHDLVLNTGSLLSLFLTFIALFRLKCEGHWESELPGKGASRTHCFLGGKYQKVSRGGKMLTESGC
jgi:hypothetical protein